jgi:hypothetical protein
MHAAKLIAALLVLSPLACAPAASSPQVANELDSAEQQLCSDAAQSGSRLKAQFLQANGVRQFFQMWDSQLDLACVYAYDKNGDWRCVPTYSTFITYLDAACTKPVVQIALKPGAQPTSPRYLSATAFSNTCLEDGFVRTTVYKRDSEVQATQLYVAGTSSGQCMPFPGFPPAPGTVQHVYALSEVAPNKLVKGEVRLSASGGSRLLERVLYGSDGSRSHLNGVSGSFGRSHFDTVLQTKVTPLPLAFGPSAQEFFWAGGTSFSFEFADATCSAAAATTDRCGLKPETLSGGFEGSFDPSSCAFSFSYKTVSGPALPVVYDRQPDGSCQPNPFADPVQFPQFAITGPAVLSRYLHGALSVQSHGGRLTTLDIVNADGSRTPTAWYDQSFGTGCQPLPVAADARPIAGSDWTCLPSSDVQVVFIDAQCTQKALVLPADPLTACSTGPRYAFEAQPNGTLKRSTVGASLGQMPIYADPGFGCFPSGAGEVFAIGSQITLPIAKLKIHQD